MSPQFFLILTITGCLDTSSAQADPREEAIPRVYLCTLEYTVAWASRTTPPKDYQRNRSISWVEVYFPRHKLAHRLGADGFIEAAPQRYEGSKPIAFDNLPRKPYPEMWRDYWPSRAHLLPELSLTEQARKELGRKLETFSKIKDKHRTTLKPLDETQARQKAAVFVNEALKKKTYKDAEGKEHPFPRVAPSDWIYAERRQDRWWLGINPPAGVTVAVSFKLDGSDPALEQASFALE
ncbi:MAG: hypothetical protein IT429_13845 [Gemmataceae bacterium]|nr:hypothetical protein [Gemmataceae bacterium]